MKRSMNGLVSVADRLPNLKMEMTLTSPEIFSTILIISKSAGGMFLVAKSVLS